METKNPAKSKTMWGALILLAPQLLESFGISGVTGPITLENVAAAQGANGEWWQGALIGVGFVLVILGRLGATTKLGLEKIDGAKLQ